MGLGGEMGKGAGRALGGCLALVALAALAILALIVVGAVNSGMPDRRPSRELTGAEFVAREKSLAILCPALAGVPAADRAVGRMQCALALLGYKPGPIDGRIGRRTQEALDAYREAAGASDGENTADLVDRAVGEAIVAGERALR